VIIISYPARAAAAVTVAAAPRLTRCNQSRSLSQVALFQVQPDCKQTRADLALPSRYCGSESQSGSLAVPSPAGGPGAAGPGSLTGLGCGPRARGPALRRPARGRGRRGQLEVIHSASHGTTVWTQILV
jgi:hypothetical protein